jgi:hypothetical protein
MSLQIFERKIKTYVCGMQAKSMMNIFIIDGIKVTTQGMSKNI